MTDAVTPDQSALMRATGHAITLIATMLSGAGMVPMGEFWRRFGLTPRSPTAPIRGWRHTRLLGHYGSGRSRRSELLKLFPLREGAPEHLSNRATLWNVAEAGEKRKDAPLAREVEFSIPREMIAVEQRLERVGDQLADRREHGLLASAPGGLVPSPGVTA